MFHVMQIKPRIAQQSASESSSPQRTRPMATSSIVIGLCKSYDCFDLLSGGELWVINVYRRLHPAEWIIEAGREEQTLGFQRNAAQVDKFSFPKQTTEENHSARSFQAKDLLRNCEAWSCDFPTTWSLMMKLRFQTNSRVWKKFRRNVP